MKGLVCQHRPAPLDITIHELLRPLFGLYRGINPEKRSEQSYVQSAFPSQTAAMTTLLRLSLPNRKLETHQPKV